MFCVTSAVTFVKAFRCGNNYSLCFVDSVGNSFNLPASKSAFDDADGIAPDTPCLVAFRIHNNSAMYRKAVGVYPCGSDDDFDSLDSLFMRLRLGGDVA